VSQRGPLLPPGAWWWPPRQAGPTRPDGQTEMDTAIPIVTPKWTIRRGGRSVNRGHRQTQSSGPGERLDL